jgi:hypothetical protein
MLCACAAGSAAHAALAATYASPSPASTAFGGDRDNGAGAAAAAALGPRARVRLSAVEPAASGPLSPAAGRAMDGATALLVLRGERGAGAVAGAAAAATAALADDTPSPSPSAPRRLGHASGVALRRDGAMFARRGHTTWATVPPSTLEALLS